MTSPTTIERPQQLGQLLNTIAAAARDRKPECSRDVYDYKGAIHHIEARKVVGGVRFRLNGAPSGRDAVFACILGE